MVTKSIIEPADAGAKAPLKKSTLLWIGAVCILVMAIGAMIAGGGQRPPAAKVEPEQQSEPRRGTARELDAELANAARAPAPLPVPIPQDARRSDSSAAGVEKKFDPEDERRKAAIELEAAARVSKMMVLNGRDEPPTAPASSQPLQAAQRAEDEALEKTRNENRQRSASILMDQKAATQVRAVNPNVEWSRELASEQPAIALLPKRIKGKHVLTQGKVIPAVLMRNLNSDLPGEVVAQTSVDVYDSFDGVTLLIPKGSTLVGRYSNEVAMGQSRLMFAFQRLIMPNGFTFDLPAAAGMDSSGASGVTGDVNNHFFRMFGSSLLVALLADRVERNAPPANQSQGNVGIPGLVNPSAATAARSAGGQVLLDVSRTILDRNRNIPPTITIEAGTRLNVQVAADMEFPTAFKAVQQ